MSDKFTWEPGEGEVVLPQCALCKHLDRANPVAACAAFPGAIPPSILRNEADHRVPWIDPVTDLPGDRGIPLERSITFEPLEGVAPAALEALYRHLDRT
jgi:hypothetical protein